jgi:hypothetical protein
MKVWNKSCPGKLEASETTTYRDFLSSPNSPTNSQTSELKALLSISILLFMVSFRAAMCRQNYLLYTAGLRPIPSFITFTLLFFFKRNITAEIVFLGMV